MLSSCIFCAIPPLNPSSNYLELTPARPLALFKTQRPRNTALAWTAAAAKVSLTRSTAGARSVGLPARNVRRRCLPVPMSRGERRISNFVGEFRAAAAATERGFTRPFLAGFRRFLNRRRTSPMKQMVPHRRQRWALRSLDNFRLSRLKSDVVLYSMSETGRKRTICCAIAPAKVRRANKPLRLPDSAARRRPSRS